MSAQTIDSEDAACVYTGAGWTHAAADPGAFGGSISYAGPSGTGLNAVVATFMGLTPGVPVYLGITWTYNANRATNVPLTVLDSDGTTVLLGPIAVNQELGPADFGYGDSNWKAIGPVTPTGTSVSIKITDNANEYVISDGYYLDTVPNTTAPSASFDYNNANVILNGLFTAPADNLGLGATIGGAAHSYILTTVHGTKCEVLCQGFNGYPMQVAWTVDGGAEQLASYTPSTGLGENHRFTLFSGLSDGPHVIKVYTGPSSVICAFNCTGLFRVSDSSAPSLSGVAGYTNDQFPIVGTSGIYVDTNGVLNSAPGSADGYPVVGGQIRFFATTNTIRLWCGYGDGRFDHAIGLYVDRDPLSVRQIAPSRVSSGWGWISFEDLDDTQEHEYWLISGDTSAYSIMLPGGTLNTTALSALPMTYWCGDSTTAGLTVRQPFNWVTVYSLLTGRTWVMDGQSGGTFPGRGVSTRHNPGLITNNPPDEAIYLFGINDAALIGDGSNPGYPPTDWDNAIYDGTTGSVVGAINADLPSCKVYIAALPELQNENYPDSTTSLLYQGLNARTAALVSSAAQANLLYIPHAALGDVNVYHDFNGNSDGQHFDRVSTRRRGYLLRDAIHPAAPASSYIVFGVEAHPRNFPVPSVVRSHIPVILTLQSPDGDATGTTVTLHTTGTGTFSSNTVALSGTVSTSLLSYTPSHADENTTVTISFTNDNLLTNPTSVSFDVVPGPIIVDDSDAGCTLTGSWAPAIVGGYRNGDHAISGTPGGTGERATYVVTGLTPGDYRIYWTWRALGGASANVQFIVKDSDGTTQIGTDRISQVGEPSPDLVLAVTGFPTSTRPMQAVADVTITGTSLTFVVTDDATGGIRTDAIAVVSLATPPGPFKPENIIGLRFMEADRMPLLDGYITNRIFDLGTGTIGCNNDPNGVPSLGFGTAIYRESVPEFNDLAAFEFYRLKTETNPNSGVTNSLDVGSVFGGYYFPHEGRHWTSGTVIVVFRDCGYAAQANEPLFNKKNAEGGFLARNGSTVGSWGGAMPDDGGGTKSKYLAIPDDGTAHVLMLKSDGTAFTVQSGSLSDGNTIALDSDTQPVTFGVNDSNTNIYGGQMAAMYWIPRELTAGESSDLSSYIADKYAISAPAASTGGGLFGDIFPANLFGNIFGDLDPPIGGEP
jgi:hypothetical protein